VQLEFVVLKVAKCGSLHAEHKYSRDIRCVSFSTTVENNELAVTQSRFLLECLLCPDHFSVCFLHACFAKTGVNTW
jgi:hypothetical protein